MDTRRTYRFAVAVAIGASLMLLWAAAGVGIIGADGDPANRIFLVVPAIGLVGALLVWFRAAGMAFVLSTMALAQASIGAYAIVGGLGMPYSPPLELAGLTGFFVMLFAGAAWMFRRAARTTPAPADGSELTADG